jgi:hypothetical protein
MPAFGPALPSVTSAENLPFRERMILTKLRLAAAFLAASLKVLSPGSVYSEPRSVNHFGRTGKDAVIVHVAGYGPTDTRYFDPANETEAAIEEVIRRRGDYCFGGSSGTPTAASSLVASSAATSSLGV